MNKSEPEKTVAIDQDNIEILEDLARTTGKTFEETVNFIIRRSFKGGFKTSGLKTSRFLE